MISTASSLYTPRLDAVGRWLSPLALRALLAWEFFESGREKLGGQNWFADLEGRFELDVPLFRSCGWGCQVPVFPDQVGQVFVAEPHGYDASVVENAHALLALVDKDSDLFGLKEESGYNTGTKQA